MCENYHPDNVFHRFKMVEFPTSFVGLSTAMELDVEVDLTTSAYLKTMLNGQLLKFEDARELSAAHRAYTISYIDKHTISITFKPTNECVSKARSGTQSDNRFVFDLRLIQVDGVRCCNNELHAEIGRYYISGIYEYCQISHYPQIVDVGDIYINNTVSKYLRIKNDSNGIVAKLQYQKVTGLDVSPSSFTILPKSSRRISVSVKPTCLKIANCLHFTIENPQNVLTDLTKSDENFLSYNVTVKSNILIIKKSTDIVVESMHKLIQQEPRYTYIGKELITHLKRKETAKDLLQACKAHKKILPPKERLCTGTVRCYSEESIKPKREAKNFCKKIIEKLDTYALFNVSILPHNIDFGNIGLDTFGEEHILIKNNTKYDVTIKFLYDDCILYSEEKVHNLTLKIKKFTDMSLTVVCTGSVIGNHTGTFAYAIDNKYHRKHPYKLEVEVPSLFLQEKNLKFGMVTNESFVTSVPVKMYNNFNIPVSFQWAELHPDTPFEITPSSGSIPRHACKICDVIYICTASKSKTHEVDLVSYSNQRIPIELNVITRKLSIKFLQPAVVFKDIPLNLTTVERVKLENSSREIALFHVVEPLIPGLTIEPMSGTIRPKMVLTFEIIAKMSCIMEFAFDIYVKINNKENVILPISGNVVEPKIIIHPKNIFMSRVPCHMVTYVPVTFQNVSAIKSTVEVLDTGDDNIFNVYIAVGNEKQRIYEFTVDGGQTKTVYIKVYDIFRREYEMFIPFKINGLLGPPNENTWSTELQHYIGEYEQHYENNPRVKVKTMNKDISFCRIIGVITVPWIEFSVEKFEIDYMPHAGSNYIEFTMMNISKYYLHVTILTAKLAPHFSLDLQTEENQSIINETHIKFDLERGKQATLTMNFHPKGKGKFVATALLFLDKQMTIPYYNLTFTGKKQSPVMIPSVSRIIFPPCLVGTKMRRTFTIKFEEVSDLDEFYSLTKEENNLTVIFTNAEIISDSINPHTIVTVEIEASCQMTDAQDIIIGFCHECGSACDMEISFCFTYCALTLHSNFLVQPEDNPYPFYPLSTQSELYDYMENCSKFLEKWMFQQGFRRDLFPVIPDTFHAISTAISGTKIKGINVSYLNFVRRIAGPLMKHIRKILSTGLEEPFKYVKEIHDTYREVIKLLKSRGADLWGIQAKFLLSYEQFVIYRDNVTPKYNSDIILTQELLGDVKLFERLNKQSWIDFILQSYKVFVMDSCFFDCVCLTSQPRDVIQVIIDWYNEQIRLQHKYLRGKDEPLKLISNITTDLSNGIAIISAILNYCPFMKEYFSIFCEIDQEDIEGGIINNACLIIEALNQLRFFFPIMTKDFLQPNFLQMLFLSIHLYVALPMFMPKDYIKFQPPLLRSSTRQVAICPSSQESLIFNFIILNNNQNNFAVEKAAPADNGKKMYLNIKYIANFVGEEDAVLLVHGYNKTRIFDTYIIFMLHGHIGSLNPVRKCKVTGPLYRPNKVDILVASPFQVSSSYKVYLTDTEPTIPVKFEDITMPKFYLQRLNLIDKEINLTGLPKESGQEIQEHKLYLQLICLSTQVGNSWIWFRGEIGEFFIRVTSQPRWDLAIDTLQTKVHTWPMDPCSCGEACECYRTTVLMIPHRNELMLKAMRYALLEYASNIMMTVFDQLIETTTGKLVLAMLLAEGGTNMSDVNHILKSELSYRVSSRALIPRLDKVRLAHHTSAMLALPVTIPADDKAEKYSVTFTSECGMDIRTYRIFFIASNPNTTSETTSS